MQTPTSIGPWNRLFRFVVATAVIGITLATAAPPADARAGQPDPNQRERGLMLVAAVGMDGCTGRQCWNTYPLMYTRLHAMFRVFKYLATGVHMAVNFLAPDFPVGGGRVEFWDLLVGPEVRGLVPLGKFDIWAGFAFGYYLSKRLVDDAHEVVSTTTAFGLGWGLGLDYYLIAGEYGQLALGGDLWFYKPFPTELCSRVGRNAEDCREAGGSGIVGLTDQFGVTYAAGVTLTWFYSL